VSLSFSAVPVRHLVAAVAAAVAVLSLTVADTSVQASQAAGCVPEVLRLDHFDGTNVSSIEAMNDRGWAVGHSGNPGPQRAVLWRDGSVVDLGLGGRVSADGHWITGSAVDVNENGVVAVGTYRYHPERPMVPAVVKAWLWRDGVRTRLPAGAQRSAASVSALNDRGVAVGSVSLPDDSDPSSRPVYWRAGEMRRLPIPPRALSGAAVQNNNHGLVVGLVQVASASGAWSELRPWFWRIGGNSGPLTAPSGRRVFGWAVDVDDRDRTVGYVDGPVEWERPRADGRRLPWARLNVNATNDYGDVVGRTSGDRTTGTRPWIGHRSDDSVKSLPALPGATEEDSASANAVIRGVTAFAPNGGVSVGGYSSDGSGHRAVIWTCAYRQLDETSRFG
jgi:hypothetical protein